MNAKHIIGFLAGIIVIVGAVALVTDSSNPPASAYDLDAFAQCLKDNQAVFYGTFWCLHCQATKRMFGNAKDKLPYVECSTPDGQNQLKVCADQKIEAYPTWTFRDGTRVVGELSLEDLSKKSGCPLIPIFSSNASATLLIATSTTSAEQ